MQEDEVKAVVRFGSLLRVETWILDSINLFIILMIPHSRTSLAASQKVPAATNSKLVSKSSNPSKTSPFRYGIESIEKTEVHLHNCFESAICVFSIAYELRIRFLRSFDSPFLQLPHHARVGSERIKLPPCSTTGNFRCPSAFFRYHCGPK